MQPDKLQLALEKAKRTSAFVEVRRATGRREAPIGGGDPAGRGASYWVPSSLLQVAYATYPPRLSPPRASCPSCLASLKLLHQLFPSKGHFLCRRWMRKQQG